MAPFGDVLRPIVDAALQAGIDFSRGDVIVTLNVEIPRRLSPAQRRLLEQARAAR